MKPFLTFLCCIYSLLIFGQEYSYTNYTDKEGLAGSVVHSAVQDNDGYLWFGTETGLSRFDGTHFKNFYKEDGLPDNEIIKLFADSKGRVWMAPFKRSISYYHKNKIHNQENDSVLKKINIKRYVVGFTEDEQGTVLIDEVAQFHLLTSNNEVRTFDKINGMGMWCNEAHPIPGGGFWVVNRDSIFILKNNEFRFVKRMNFYIAELSTTAFDYNMFAYLHYTRRKDSAMGLYVTRPVGMNSWQCIHQKIDSTIITRLINMFVLDESRIAIGTKDGVLVYNPDNLKKEQHFLPGMSISNGMKDAEGNLWFCTQGQGIFRLNSEVVRNVKLTDDKKSPQIYCFERTKQSILAGSDVNNTIYEINVTTGKLTTHSYPYAKTNSPVTYIVDCGNNEVVYGSNYYLVKASLTSKAVQRLSFIYTKALLPYKNKLLVATPRNILQVDLKRFVVDDTVWRERGTTLFADNDTIYIGTINGLFRRLPNKTIQDLSAEMPVLKGRIAAIAKDKYGVLWIATYGDGVVGWKNHRLVAAFTRQGGLTSNTCRTMCLHNDALWVGTDKGLNKISIHQPGYPIKKFTTSDGLLSDIINALHIEDGKVYVGSRDGLSFFDDEHMNRSSSCGMLFTDITVNGQLYSLDSMPMALAHNVQNIRFEYAGISYRSAGDIRYRYRLIGLDTEWRETRETFLSYPTLPSGQYELQLQAINKFDVPSKIITATFSVEYLLWEKLWFQLLMGVLFVGLTVGLAILIVNRIKRRDREKAAIDKRIFDLEQLARKAQMNPHFIFNSLNSIQQYVMDADIVGANKFISGFSKLIRQTLDFSSKHEIGLEEELDYLKNYLSLEQTRLEHTFIWSLEVARNVKLSDHHIPPMILQPFVENSLRHGLRFRKDQGGKITISIKREPNYLVCILEDNGIGRKAAQRYKSANPIEYQSKGMSLTAERISLLNANSSQKISMDIDDLEDEEGKALGTRVSLRFPTV